MITTQIIQNSIDELKNITRVDLIVFDPEGRKIAATLTGSAGEDVGSNEENTKLVNNFVKSEADSQVVGLKHLLKVKDEGETTYVLMALGAGDDAYLIGRICVSQLQALIVAYKERFDKNNFYQNLLLDNLLLVDIYNRAKKLHIDAMIPRVVYLVEAKKEKDGLVTDLLRGMYTSQAGDAVTAVDEDTIILIKGFKRVPTEEEMNEVADTIIALVGSEALMNVKVSYGTVINELKDVSKSYKEAKMALEVGRIFYAEKGVIPYTSLGIGRLIYQLPVSLCEIFIKEIFGDGIPEELDEETRNMLNTFFENNLNVSETSRKLFVHRNTLVYRIEKMQKATGLDLRSFDDALTFKIAMMVESYLKHMEGQY